MTLTKRQTGFIALLSLAILAAILIIGGTVWAFTERSSDEEQPIYTESELAIEATTIMTTWNPREDHTQTAAELRARHLMTDELADSIQEPERSTGGADWRQAREAGATSTPLVEVTEGTHGPGVTVLARWTWAESSGANSWSPTERRAYHFTFTKEHGQLKIADYTYETLHP